MKKEKGFDVSLRKMNDATLIILGLLMFGERMYREVCLKKTRGHKTESADQPLKEIMAEMTRRGKKHKAAYERLARNVQQ